jgi:3'-phosphoadenosine 5'-phosphosulfate sulfotransferase (PAPS reductase)/FAD synthetase
MPTTSQPPVTAATLARKRRNRNAPGYDAAGEWLAGTALLDAARAYAGDTLLLAFSGGKDSVAMWLWLREVAPEVKLIPFFMDMIPGLQLISDMLAYYEDFFQTHIAHMVHPSFYADLIYYTFQTPENVRLIRACNLPPFTRQDVCDLLAEEAGLKRPLHAMGLRRKDNPIRSGLMTVARPIGTKQSSHFYPIWDWDTAQVASIIKRYGVKLPVGYAYWGRNLVNLEYNVLQQVRSRFPADFAVIQTWYPLIGAEFFRYEVVGQ